MRLQGKRITPHSLRHTFASLHLSTGTNQLWVQRQGGWKSLSVLLDTYAHFMPSELSGRGFADALTALDGPKLPKRHVEASPVAKPPGGKDVPLQPVPAVTEWWARRGSNPGPTD